jgi:predicted nucleic-acid-binding Zn-ribbon protein
MKGQIMHIEMKCLRCGGTNVKPSHLQSTGKLYSRPKNSSFLAYLLTGTPISALTCFDCGHVELIVDTKKIKAMLKSA